MYTNWDYLKTNPPAVSAAVDIPLDYKEFALRGINIKWLGAKGDGSDESDIIIKALNEAKTSGVLYIPYGTFYGKNISIPSNIKIIGPGTLKTHSSAQLGDCLLQVNGKTNIDISIKLDGNKGIVGGSEASGVTLLQIINSSKIYVHDSTFQNNLYLAVSISNGSSEITVAHNKFSDVDCAVITQGTACNQIKVYNNLIDGGASEGISIFGVLTTGNVSNNILIANNIIINKTVGSAVYVRAGNKVSIVDNVINNCAWGVNLTTNDNALSLKNTNVVVTGNNITDASTGGGILLENCEHCLITSNLISNVQQSGIGVYDSINNTIENNTVINTNLSGGSFYPIFLTSSSKNILNQNTIRDDNTPIKHTQGIVINGTGGAPSIGNVITKNIGLDTGIPMILLQTDAQSTIVNDNIGSSIIDQGTNNIIYRHMRSATSSMSSNLTVSTAAITFANNLTTLIKLDASGPISVTSITAGVNSREVTLMFTNTNITLVDGGNLRLNGNFTPTSSSAIIKLVCDGTNWYEVARSNN